MSITVLPPEPTFTVHAPTNGEDTFVFDNTGSGDSVRITVRSFGTKEEHWPCVIIPHEVFRAIAVLLCGTGLPK